MTSKKDFEETIKKVKKFYSEYDKVVSNVDDLFETIDNNAGKVKDELREIRSELEKFWEKYDFDGKEEASKIFSELYEKLRKEDNSEQEFLDILKEIQLYFRNCSAIESKPIVHHESDDVIEYLFETLRTGKFIDVEFTVTKILSELITDDMLVRCGISCLDKWNYGTDGYCSLTAEEQLVVILNQSIMIDRIHGEQHLLKTYLKRLNRLVISFKELDWTVYYVVGFLNFKIHNYRESKEFFEIVERHKDLLKSGDAKQKKRYFHASLLIAYGYEYEGKFAEAINKLANSVENIYKLIENYSFKDIKDNVSKLLDGLAHECSKGSLFHVYFAQMGNGVSEQILKYDNSDTYNIQIEILHALAHCLNEYAIKNSETESNMCPKLIVFARAIMKYIAQFVCEYWTCYATIHGEYKDYDVALEELSNAREKIKKRNGVIKESLSAEIDFYCYYFNQMIRQSAMKEHNHFFCYCKKYSDDDAECHVQIFEFRSKLRKYLSDLFEELRLLNQSSKAITSLLPIDKITEEYDKICKLRPSLYMNINVRAELQLMQRIYMVIFRLREYLMDASVVNCKNLINSCKRYCSVKKELNLSEKDDFPVFEIDEISVLSLPIEVNKTLFGEHGIVHCLNASDSVFLLAPISGVVVYQYQTGTIDNLFDVNSLLSLKTGDTKIFHHNQMARLVEYYIDTVSQVEQQYIVGLNWEDLNKERVKTVFLWSEDVPFRLLQATEDKQKSRWLTDPNKFISILNEASNTPQQNCIKKNRRGLCRFNMLKIKWLEVINESNNEINIFSQKKNVDGIERCLIVVGDFAGFGDSEKNENCVDRHKVHDLLEKIEIAYIEEQNSDDIDNPIDYLSQDCNPNLIIPELKKLYEKFKEAKIDIEVVEKDIRKYSQGSKGDIEGKKMLAELNKKKDMLYTECINILKILAKIDYQAANDFCVMNDLYWINAIKDE